MGCGLDRLSGGGVDRLLSALDGRGRGRAGRLLRARNAEPRGAGAVRRRPQARGGVPPRLRRAGDRSGPQAPLQHLRAGGRGRPHHRQVPQDPPARLRRGTPGRAVPEPGEALLRGGQPGLAGVGGVRRPRRHDDLQRPPLARGLAGDGPARASSWCCSATTRRCTTRRCPRPTTSATSTTTWSCRPAPTRTAPGWSAAAKAGVEEGVDQIGQSCIIAPSGEIVAQCTTLGDELQVARCDLDLCTSYKQGIFNFASHRRTEHYGLIVERTGAGPVLGAKAGNAIPG